MFLEFLRGVVSHASYREMAEDEESDIAIGFVDENDYREISAKGSQRNGN